MDDDLLTTGDVARYCQVSPVTVFRWVRNGKLEAYTTPGGHYRIRKGDFRAFLKESGMPIRSDFFGGDDRRVLVVSRAPQVAGSIVDSLRESGDQLEVVIASDSIDAGLQLAIFKPELVILDATLADSRACEICRFMKDKSPVQPLKILLVIDTSAATAAAIESDADDFIRWPAGHLDLQQKVGLLLNGHC
ncbi:MAG: helix-turn-helix domain-containing protein [Chloroflexota bacterium]|nr:helix-turn-helix domain-containing protein [Chloroflexota bacterium]